MTLSQQIFPILHKVIFKFGGKIIVILVYFIITVIVIIIIIIIIIICDVLSN